MTVDSAENRLILAFLASTAAHILAVLLIVFLVKLPSSPPSFEIEQQRFEIENLTQQQIERIRQVGVRGGRGEGFSRPIPTSSEPEQATKPVPAETSQQKQTSRQVNFGDLSPGQVAPKLSAQSKQQELTKTNSEITTRTQTDRADLSLRLNDQQSRLNRQQEVIQGDVLRELRSSTQAADVLRTTGFNLQFDPPEGIEESELNTVEKIFYSFQRRTYTSYVTTFISNYHQMSFQRSRLKRILERETHDLTGRVVFNRDGDVISIRILKGSPSEDVQDLFEKTLKDLKLPNPPRDLVRSDGQFVIYYRLKIN